MFLLLFFHWKVDKLCLFWLYRQKHMCGIMMYQLMPRLLPRPNMNFYLAWKKRSLQKRVSAIYYCCVPKKKKSLKPLKKVLQKLLTNDPMRACSLCCAALRWTTVQVPYQRSLLVWPQKMENDSSSLSYAPTFLFVSPGLPWSDSGDSCAGDTLAEGVPALLCSHAFCNCICWNMATSACRSCQECPSWSAHCSSYS